MLKSGIWIDESNMIDIVYRFWDWVYFEKTKWAVLYYMHDKRTFSCSPDCTYYAVSGYWHTVTASCQVKSG